MLGGLLPNNTPDCGVYSGSVRTIRSPSCSVAMLLDQSGLARLTSGASPSRRTSAEFKLLQSTLLDAAYNTTRWSSLIHSNKPILAHQRKSLSDFDSSLPARRKPLRLRCSVDAHAVQLPVRDCASRSAGQFCKHSHRTAALSNPISIYASGEHVGLDACLSSNC